MNTVTISMEFDHELTEEFVVIALSKLFLKMGWRVCVGARFKGKDITKLVNQKIKEADMKEWYHQFGNYGVDLTIWFHPLYRFNKTMTPGLFHLQVLWFDLTIIHLDEEEVD